MLTISFLTAITQNRGCHKITRKSEIDQKSTSYRLDGVGKIKEGCLITTFNLCDLQVVRYRLQPELWEGDKPEQWVGGYCKSPSGGISPSPDT